MFTLTINTCNGAFSDGNAASETARILRDCATRIEAGEGDLTLNSVSITLRDINGNVVGHADYEESDD
jgi:hypothetical protein